jgi:hypothetical protein
LNETEKLILKTAYNDGSRDLSERRDIRTLIKENPVLKDLIDKRLVLISIEDDPQKLIIPPMVWDRLYILNE